MPISARMIDDVFLSAAFYAYRENPSIARLCKTMKAYLEMPSTLEDLGEQGMLDEYSQWEYRVLKFKGLELLGIPPAATWRMCNDCQGQIEDHGTLIKLIEQDNWPMPFGNNTKPRPSTSPGAYTLFKHLVKGHGLHYFFQSIPMHVAINPNTPICTCHENLDWLINLSQYLLPIRKLFENNLRGVITTDIPQLGITIRYDFGFSYKSEIQYCSLTVTQIISSDGSPIASSELRVPRIRHYDLYLFRKQREVHTELFDALETGSTCRPTFATDNLLGYAAYYVLSQSQARQEIWHFNLARYDPTASETYIANAKLTRVT
jgi:hypothetical protein